MQESMEVTVCSSELVAPAVRRLSLQTRDGRALPPLTPGDHVRLARLGMRPVPVSVAARPAPDRYQVLIADCDGEADRTPQLSEVLRLDGPGNGMPLQGRPASLRLIGAGLGVAPLLPLARALSTTDARMRLCWIGRGIAASALLTELQTEFGHCVRFHDTAGEGRPDLRTVIGRPEQSTHVYCAGPIPFVDALLAAAAQLGWSADALHWDRYMPVTVPAGLKQVPPSDSPGTVVSARPMRSS